MPIKKILFICCIISSLAVHAQEKTFSIMLDPSGDAKTPGRALEDSFERGVTLQCAERLKNILEQRNSTIRVILTRFAGETVEPLQNAHFANRLDVDLFISLNFYQETAAKPLLYVYTFSYGATPTSMSDSAFYSYDNVYWLNYRTTSLWANTLLNVLQDSFYHKLFECKGVYSLPFKPLIGIKAPAFGFEFGLKNKKDWELFIDALVASLEAIIMRART